MIFEVIHSASGLIHTTLISINQICLKRTITSSKQTENNYEISPTLRKSYFYQNHVKVLAMWLLDFIDGQGKNQCVP